MFAVEIDSIRSSNSQNWLKIPPLRFMIETLSSIPSIMALAIDIMHEHSPTNEVHLNLKPKKTKVRLC